MSRDLEGLIDGGRAALRDCDWATAESCFEEARRSHESPDVLDGLGQALYWQHRYAEALPLRERAYALYREQGEHRAAALVAVRLAQLHGLIHGSAAAVNGWIGHAQRMLERCADCPERGWLEVFLGSICADPAERERRARRAAEVGRRFGSPALEFQALGYVGKARVELGEIQEGMALVDEAVAAASSGLVADPWATGEIYCALFHTCEMAIDVQRAETWLTVVDGYVERTGELPISAICRMHYGGLLAAAGRWDDAEQELVGALAIYQDTYRGTSSEPLLRLADLRVRQGRFEEAERLLDGYEDDAAAALPRARLLLARGQAELADRALHRLVPTGDCPLPAAPMVALQVDVRLARGDVGAARTLARQLVGLAERTGLASITGLAWRARARIAAAVDDTDAAMRLLDDAIAAFADAGLSYERAVTRLELAQMLSTQVPEVARAEARTALRTFEALGSTRDADAAASLLRELGDTGRSRPRSNGVLTTRQAEVLDLLAEGLSNSQIAERLFISPRTAEHHVSNILAALGLSSRAEAAAFVHRRSLA